MSTLGTTCSTIERLNFMSSLLTNKNHEYGVLINEADNRMFIEFHLSISIIIGQILLLNSGDWYISPSIIFKFQTSDLNEASLDLTLMFFVPF